MAVFLLAVLSQGVGRAQDTESDNPTGPSGDFNGEVTTAGSYDPFTGNVKRRVTDLTVPGSNGAYPLALSRTFNSQYYAVGSDFTYFDDAGNWRHSYQWTLSVSNSVNGNTTAYNVAYPDGSVITFRPGRGAAPASEYATYWRGPSGTTDRLEVQSSSNRILHTADGGVVNFGSAPHPYNIVDPNGAITKLDYQANNPNYLAQVTEPGGRWLKFFYVTASYSGRDASGHAIFHMWTLLHQVQASTGQTVTYSEAISGVQVYNEETGATIPNYVLSDVSYDQESLASGSSGNVHAVYTYDQGALVTATDPHYAGAMVNIRYSGYGYSFEEQNMGTQQRVSRLDITPGTSTTTSVETRGDTSSGTGNTSGSGANVTRTFTYGSNDPGTKKSVLTSMSDFEARTSYKEYYGLADKDTNGKSFLKSETDARNTKVSYQHEPLTGKTTVTTLPDNRTRTASWRAADDSSTMLPYYLYQSTDERGQTTTYHHYSNTGLVYQIDYPDGAHEYYQYQGFNGNGGAFYKVSFYQNKLGAQITYGYDETDVNHGGSGFAGLLTSVTRSYTSPVNGSHTETTRFYYDGLDRVNKTVDPSGVTATFQYNPRHQLTQTTHAADNTSVISGYDDYGNRTSVTDELGHTATTGYDEYRRVSYTQVPVNAPMANGQQLASRYVAFAYERRDNSNQLVGDALSHTGSNWSVTWMPSGAASQRIFSPNNRLTDEYDGMYVNGGQYPVVPVPWSGCVHTSRTYNSIGQVKTATDAQGFVTTYNYDTSNRLYTVTDPLNHQTVNSYYGAGEQCPLGAQLNGSGLLKQVTGPGPDLANFAAVSTRYGSYDVMGRSTKVESPYTPGQSSSPYTIMTGSGYDPAGNLTSQSDGAQASGQHSTGYAYDYLGRKASCGYPDGTNETWTYDASGNVSTFKDRRGDTCTYLYDGRSRCYYSSWSNNAGYWTYYGYDAASHVTEVSNPIADILFDYDDSGALIKERERPANQSVYLATRYTHDLDGNVDKITYPNGNFPCFSYDAQHRCTGMNSGGTTFSRYDYYGDWLAGRWLFNHLYTGYGYQNNGRVNDVWHFHVDNNGGYLANVRRHGYGYAPDGQISWVDREADGTHLDGTPSPAGASGSILENGRGDVFYYWPNGSLGIAPRDVAINGGWPSAFSATADSRVAEGNISYAGGSATTYCNNYGAYDAAGNRAGVLAQMGQASVPYAVDGENRYTTTGFRYDDLNGNTTQTSEGWTFAYDTENHLKSASNAATGQYIAFDYDGLGRLIAQINNNVYTLFYYAGSQRIEERNSSNQLVYLYFYDAPGSDRILFREGGGWGRLWYQYDLLGNTTHLSAEVAGTGGQAAGQVIEQYLYDAYGTPTVFDAAGNVRPGGSVYDNRYLFKGSGAYQWLSQAQLYYCRARCYLPQHGRWLQPDPIGQSGGLNIYAYCGNDPVNSIDPSGLEAGSIDWYGNHIQQSAGAGYDPGTHWTYQFSAMSEYGRADVYAALPGGLSVNDPQSRGFSNSRLGGTFGGLNAGGRENVSDLFAGLGDRVARDVLSVGGFLEENASRMTGIGDGTVFSSLEELLGQIEIAKGVNPESPQFQFGQQGGNWVELGASLPFGGPEVKAVESAGELITVSRWGSEGLNPGNWVMKGPANLSNYLRSGKWQPRMGNEFAPFKSGQEFTVPRGTVQWPKGWGIDGWWKGIFGQRKYVPPGG